MNARCCACTRVCAVGLSFFSVALDGAGSVHCMRSAAHHKLSLPVPAMTSAALIQALERKQRSSACTLAETRDTSR